MTSDHHGIVNFANYKSSKTIFQAEAKEQKIWCWFVPSFSKPKYNCESFDSTICSFHLQSVKLVIA